MPHVRAAPRPSATKRVPCWVASARASTSHTIRAMPADRRGLVDNDVAELEIHFVDDPPGHAFAQVSDQYWILAGLARGESEEIPGEVVAHRLLLFGHEREVTTVEGAIPEIDVGS